MPGSIYFLAFNTLPSPQGLRAFEVAVAVGRRQQRRACLRRARLCRRAPAPRPHNTSWSLQAPALNAVG